MPELRLSELGHPLILSLIPNGGAAWPRKDELIQAALDLEQPMGLGKGLGPEREVPLDDDAEYN